MKKLCVEGWRSIHHSYAMVNQWQLLSLVKHRDIDLSVRDLPFFKNDWERKQGLFSVEQENALAGIKTAARDGDIDATLRVSFPLDFSLPPRGRVAVFGTSEFQVIDPSMLAGPFDLASVRNSDSIIVITPSRWSSGGFVKLGLRPDQVCVVPHGLDPNIFSSWKLRRRDARRKLGLNGFTFINASGMTSNKGIDLLLRAFAVVVEKNADARLLLKGADALYPSKDLLARTISELPARIKALVVDRISYLGEAISNQQMAEFYQAGDAYVSPYRAEGFNLPVLESCACGTPAICTKGGATDDFMKDEFALFVESTLKTREGNAGGVYLEPNLDHLIAQMLRIMENDTWRRRSSLAGSAYVSSKFNWDSVVDSLLDAIFPPAERRPPS